MRPVIALSELSDGDVIEVVCDDRETLRDIPLLCKRLNVSLISIEEDSGEFTFLIKKTVFLEIFEWFSDEISIMEKGGVPADAKLPTDQGDFRIRVFHDATSGLDHVALTLGEMGGPNPVLVRVHSECLTGDAFGSLRCDCGPQLNAAIRQIQEVGWGCIVYLRQEGRGIGLHAKIQAYNLQDKERTL